MSLLASLECVQSSPKEVRTNQISMMRQKLIDRISDQIALAGALQAGDGYQRLRYRRIRDLESGDIAEVPTKARVRPWWVEDQDGSLLLWIKYGNRSLELQKGKAAIRLASKKDIAPTLELVRAAVRAGEFDQKILAAVKAFQNRFGRRPVA